MNEFAVPRVGVGCIVERDGKVLMSIRKSKHGRGYWSFPGGHLEFGETIEACAKRELEEETGLLASVIEPVTWVENPSLVGDRHYVTFLVFIKDYVGDPQTMEPDKHGDWQWFDWDALPEPLFATIPWFLEKVDTLPLSHTVQASQP